MYIYHKYNKICILSGLTNSRTSKNSRKTSRKIPVQS